MAIGWFWLVAGAALGALSTQWLYSGLNAIRRHLTADIYGSLIVFAFAAVAALAGYGVLHHKRWAFLLLCTDCVFGILYGAVYDTGWPYAAAVGTLALASLVTPILWAVTRKQVEAEVLHDSQSAAGQGGITPLSHAGRPWPALPKRWR